MLKWNIHFWLFGFKFPRLTSWFRWCNGNLMDTPDTIVITLHSDGNLSFSGKNSDKCFQLFFYRNLIRNFPLRSLEKPVQIDFFCSRLSRTLIANKKLSNCNEMEQNYWIHKKRARHAKNSSDVPRIFDSLPRFLCSFVVEQVVIVYKINEKKYA